jgi:chromosome segregation ATPase
MSATEQILQKSIEILTLLFTKQERLDVTQSFKELMAERHALKSKTNDLEKTNEELLKQTMHFQDVAEAYRHQVLEYQVQLEEKERSLANMTLAEQDAKNSAADWHEKFLRLEYRAKELASCSESYRLEKENYQQSIAAYREKIAEMRTTYKLNKYAQEWADFLEGKLELKALSAKVDAETEQVVYYPENA